MGIAFGLFILVILALALYNRRREHKTWVAEERREESGDWIDKRAGERGTYGSLDALHEAERHSLSRQGRINDLVLDIRNFMFEQVPGFHERSDGQLKAFNAYARERARELFAAMDALKAGQAPTPGTPAPSQAPRQALKKAILDFCYDAMPALLDLDLNLIRQFDTYVEGLAGALLDEAGRP